MPKPKYDIKTLQDYLAGKLDAKAMHALEKQALEDPLLAEALEGLEGNPDLWRADLSSAMDRLADRLNNRVAISAEGKDPLESNDVSSEVEDTADVNRFIPVKSLYGARNLRKWLGAAAIIVIIFAGGWFYYALPVKDAPWNNNRVSYHKEISSAVTKALGDSNTHGAEDELAKKSGSENSGAEIPGAENPVAAAANATARSSRETTPELREIQKDTDGASRGADQLAMAPATKPQAQNRRAAVNATRSAMARKSVLPQVNDATLANAFTESDTFKKGGVPGRDSASAKAKKSLTIGVYYDTGSGITGLARGYRAPSAVMLGNSRGVGQNGSIRIRGAGSIIDSLSPNYAARPFFVIDGMPVTNDRKLDSLDPAQIASVSVIKGDQGTAIYGARAAGGVVVITTKKSVTANRQTNNQTAYLKGVQLLKKKMGSLKKGAVAEPLDQQPAGLNVNKQPKKAPLRLGVQPISGPLKPKGGFAALEKYLNRQLADALFKGQVSILDTGKIYCTVRVENKTPGRGTIYHLHAEKNIRPAFENWLNGIIIHAPQWEADPDYRPGDNKETAEANGTARDKNKTRDSTRTEILIIVSKQ